MDAVRGKYVSDALAILKFVPNFAARAIEDVIKSAVANAENGRPYSADTDKPLPPLIVENLKLVRAFVDDGPRIKRLQPRAQGRAYRILKRMCHISVIVEEVEPKPKPVRKTKPTTRRAQQAAATTKPAAKPPEPKAKATKKQAEPVVEPEVIGPVAGAGEVSEGLSAEQVVAEARPDLAEAEAQTAVESEPVAEAEPAPAEAPAEFSAETEPTAAVEPVPAEEPKGK